jgi:queuine tRNA-ribosyltransferase
MKSKEYLGLTIASVHNLAFYLWLVTEARNHIAAGDFKSWKDAMVVQLQHRL